MKRNMSNTDRVVRLLIAALIGTLYFTGTIGSTLAIVLLVVAGIFIATSFVNWCPLYAVLGLSTCKVPKT
jgi:hypothetical protein